MVVAERDDTGAVVDVEVVELEVADVEDVDVLADAIVTVIDEGEPDEMLV